MTTTREHRRHLTRRVHAMGVAVLMAIGGVVAVAPSAPAAPASGTSAPRAVSVSAGGSHTCALTSTGGVACWGYNQYGQLGTGDQRNRTRPADVVGLTSGVTQISAGYISTCAVTTAGGVKCWGAGGYGQLGNGSFTSSKTPVDVVGLTTPVASVSVGAYSACALTVAGAVKCWGNGANGTLGNGSLSDSATAVDVSGLDSGVRALAVGSYHACALTGAGARCWGYNGYGQLGDGTRTTRTVPVPVARLGADAALISAGSTSTCATAGAGRVLCWGTDRANHRVLTPRSVPGLTGITSIGTSLYSTCAASARRTLCWGDNGYGTLGDGTTTSSPTPVPVVGLPGPVTVVSTGALSAHVCAITQSGRLFCWGFNLSGQLGTGTRTDSLVPARVVGFGV